MIKDRSPLNYEPVSPSDMTVESTADSPIIDISQVCDDQEYDFPAIGKIPVKNQSICKDHGNEEYDFPVAVTIQKKEEARNNSTFMEPPYSLGQNKSFLHLLPQSTSFPKYLRNLPLKDNPIEVKRQMSFSKVRSNFKPRVLFFQK